MEFTDERLDSVRRLLIGGIVGVVAFLATTVVTITVGYGPLTTANDPSRPLGTLAANMFPPVWKALCWLVLGTHFAPVRPLDAESANGLVAQLYWLYDGAAFPLAVPLSPAPGENLTRNIVILSFDGGAAAGLLLAPAVVLTVAGIVVGRHVANGLLAGRIVGLRLLSGYLPTVVLLSYVSRATISGYGYESVIGVSLLNAALVGAVYPLVFGRDARRTPLTGCARHPRPGDKRRREGSQN